MRLGVADTSALIRLYCPDGPIPEGFEEMVEAAWKGEAALIAPDLLLAEAAQVLHKKQAAGHLTIQEAEEILERILDLPLTTVPHREIIQETARIARELTLPSAEGEEPPAPLSEQAAEGILDLLEKLIDQGREQAVKADL